MVEAGVNRDKAPAQTPNTPSAQPNTAASGAPDAAEVGINMVAGAVSGALAKTSTAPLSRLTILYQVRDATWKSERPLQLHEHDQHHQLCRSELYLPPVLDPCRHPACSVQCGR
jgi:hypothetical protein